MPKPYLKISEVCDFIRGVTFTPKDLTSSDKDGSIACFRTKNVQQELDLSDVIYIPRSFVKNKQQILMSGDILISNANSKDIVGKCCYVDNLNYPATLGGFITAARAKPEKVLSRYLYYWMSSKATQMIFRSLARQTTNIANLPMSLVGNLEIPLPPLPEQERIVRLLDEAESLRATRVHANARMEQFVPALFHEIFGDLREIEKMQWELIPVGEFAKVSYGLADKLDSHTLPENGTRIITISNVTLEGTLNLSIERYSLVDISTREKAKLKYGDLLFNWRNGSEFHVGKTAFWEEQIAGEVLHVSFLLKIRSVESKVDSLYLWVLLNLLRKNGFFAKSRFQVNTKFNASELSALKLPLPPLALQREFAAQVGEARGVQSAQGKSSEKIEASYQSMLSRAFAGEL